MEKFLKRSLSIRKKKTPRLESSKPHQWQEDERKVREGTCSFQVKYLGCVEVFESRGIQVCEEAVKVLKAKKSRSAWSRLSLRKKKDDQNSKSGHHRAVLYVTGDALRVVDEISKGLIVDQTIEKVSFCAPDRNHEKGFAYICRDGTTRRWMCHGFFAVKESGERLSHAVGCAFAICLEKKQQREKEKVSVTYNENGTSFTRMGSFRQTTLTERLADPQSAIVAEPVPFRPLELPYAVERPHAPADILDRQGSFRGFNKLAESSPFKRNVSLRVNELPSTLERQKQFSGIDGPHLTNGLEGVKGPVISTIIEDEELPPSMLEEPSGSQWPIVNSFGAMKLNSNHQKQVSAAVVPPPQSASVPLPFVNTSAPANAFSRTESLQFRTSQVASTQIGNTQNVNVEVGSARLGAVVKQTNPWATPAATSPEQKLSEAENWLNSTANKIDPFAGVPATGSLGSSHRPVNSTTPQFAMPPGTFQMSTNVGTTPALHPYQLTPQLTAQSHGAYPVGVGAVSFPVQHPSVDARFQQSMAPSWQSGAGFAPGDASMVQPGAVIAHSVAPNGSAAVAPSNASVTSSVGSVASPPVDPFDSAWASKAAAKGSYNPFQQASFQVKI